MTGRERQPISKEMVASPWPAPGRMGEEIALAGGGESSFQRITDSLGGELAAAWAACGAFEWMALGYLGVSSFLIVVFAANLQHPLRLLAAQAFVAMIVLALCWVGARSAARTTVHGVTFSSGWWRFWRHWYPHLFFLFCFEELAHLMTLFTPHWQDAKLLAFDHWLTGVQPTIWLEQFVTPARNEFMQLAYLTYFVYLLMLGGILYFQKDWKAYWSVMTYSMVGYSIGYLIAMFFPVESPWFSLAGSWKAPLAGGPFTATINFIEHYGRVRGAAFPSEHVAGSIAVVWGAWKFRRWLFWVMAPCVFLMCVSTIWGRYHYVADIFAGIITGTLGYWIGSRVMRRQGALAAAATALGDTLYRKRSDPSFQ
jgi:membrane-associated phospholipid phosphatase